MAKNYFVTKCLIVFVFSLPIITGESLSVSFKERLAALNAEACRQNSGDSNSYAQLLVLFDNVPGCMSNGTSDDTSECPVDLVVQCYEPIIKVAARCIPRDHKSNELVLRNALKQLTLGQCEARKQVTQESCDARQSEQSVMQCNIPVVKMDAPISNLNAQECRGLLDTKQCIRDILRSCTSLVIMADYSVDAIYDTNECEKYSDDLAENEI